jgi:hypothetical protein
MRGIGNPKELIKNFKALEEAGVDQLILLHQCGDYKHEHICESLELFAAEVLPEFKERDLIRTENKQKELEPYIIKANQKVEGLSGTEEILPVEAYPLMWKKMSPENEQSTPDRRPGMTSFWQAQVGGKRPKKNKN